MEKQLGLSVVGVNELSNFLKGNVDLWLLSKIKWLPRIDWNIIFSDLDDTIFSRLTQLEFDLFSKNRWEKWNKVVDSIWLNNFIDFFYKKEHICREILDFTDVILTAWRSDIQSAKIVSILNHSSKDIPWLVVPRHSNKPLRVLYYIINNLWYIPSEITIYDDRISELKEDFLFLWKLLWIKVNLYEVKLSTFDISHVDTISKVA